ncbi:hypothetical protein PINS_up012569 [Pythium insidiosum]|nr:hypothetical protein PINS_up012569 [Pythium insidiosum]
MLSPKALVLSLAVVSAALLQTCSASPSSTVLRIEVHHRQHRTTPRESHALRDDETGETLCGVSNEETAVGVEGAEGMFCVWGPPCLDKNHGACPVPQPGLEFGSYCEEIRDGFMACIAYESMDAWLADHPETSDEDDEIVGDPEDDVCDTDNEETAMSVEGVKGFFCVSGQACVDKYNGACPMPQPGLEFGSYCDEVKTGVMGCKPYGSWEEFHAAHPELNGQEDETEDRREDDDEAGGACDLENEETPMSVEGVAGVFCVSGQACVEKYNGACPAPQPGLEFGSYCDEIQTGVMGCKPYSSMEQWIADHGELRRPHSLFRLRHEPHQHQ